MSPMIFWSFLLLLVWIAVSLAASSKDIGQWVVVGSIAVCAIAMCWVRWSKRGIPYLGRAAAAVGLALAAWRVYDWLPRTDVFMVCSRNCPPRAGTIWPLFFLWLLGLGLAMAAVWGRALDPRISLRRPSLRMATGWLLMVAWTAACGVVLVNNLSLDVVAASTWKAGRVVGGVVLVIIAVFGFFYMTTWRDRKIDKAVQVDFDRLTPAFKREVIGLVDKIAREGQFLLLYRPTHGRSGNIGCARIGGDPAVAVGEAWPMQEDGTPGEFLLQLPLMAPRLPVVWQGRLATVYMVDCALCIRTYLSAEVAALTTLPNPAGETVIGRRDLAPMALPYVASRDGDDGEETDAFDEEKLFERLPALAPLLTANSRHPARLLGRILSASTEGSRLSEDEVRVGGDPLLIQNTHEAMCPVCGQPMRFLFQFSDVTEDLQLGDCGMGYVYGCDAHPEHTEGFVDCY
jgi:hypothetical protein